MLITFAAALLSVTAAPQPAPTTAAAPSAAGAPAAASTSRAKYNPRVCLVDQVTGSRIPVSECRPLAQWRTDGIDPLPKR